MAFDPITAIADAVNSIASGIDSWFTSDEEAGLVANQAAAIDIEAQYADIAMLEAQDAVVWDISDQTEVITYAAVGIAILITIAIVILIVRK